MAIARTQKDNISDIEIAKEDKLGAKNGASKSDSQADNKKKSRVEKKPGFLASTISELRKVEWPGFRYVVNWSLAIIVFTAFISLFLGFADHIFGNSIQFANCVSPQNDDGQTGAECRDEFVTNITFQD